MEGSGRGITEVISIQPSNDAFINLAGVYYHLGELELAAKYYLLAEKDSDISMYSYIKCLIDLGRTKEAKEKLDFINKGSYHLIGEIEIADLYVELDCYNEAIEWFEKGYNAYSGSSYWISRFVYALYKTNNFSRLDEVIKEEIEETNKAIMQEDVNENWTEAQKRDALENYTREYNYYKQLKERVTSGYVPQLQFSAPFTSACYLFGCKRHGNPEYQG